MMLDRYGPIELLGGTDRMEHPPRHNMQGGMFVKFAFYLDCQDALKAFQNQTSGYVLILAPSMEPRLQYNRGSPVIRGFATPRSAVDQKSIFVGNLPEGTTRSDLHNLFDDFGMIVQVNVIRKVFGDDGINNFGFVEFHTVEDAEHASHAERTFKGIKLRIEPKEYSARRNPGRSSNYAPLTPAHTFTPRNPYTEMNYLNAPRMGFAQPVFDHAQANAMTQAHVFNHHHLEHHNPLHAYNMYGQGAFATPPHHNVGRMPTMGMFSPTPSHHAHPFNPIIAPPAPQYTAQPFGTTQYMNPIQEAEGEEH